MLKKLTSAALAACFALPSLTMASDLDGLTPQQLLPLAQKEEALQSSHCRAA